MSRNPKPIIAICYDFDGTLSPDYMQNHEFIPDIGLTPAKFWSDVKTKAKENKSDETSTYMYLMLERAKASYLDGKPVDIRKKQFITYGKNLPLFKGVEEWFQNINKFGDSLNIKVQHYIISSGIKSMIEGTPIAKEFKAIFASSFIYAPHNGDAKWPGQIVNFTNKTQYLFRINKNVLDVCNEDGVNESIPEDERLIPFERMFYIGNSNGDIPSMKLVKDKGGYAIALYPPNCSKNTATQLFNDQRVQHIFPADYSEGKGLDMHIRTAMKKMAAQALIKQQKV